MGLILHDWKESQYCTHVIHTTISLRNVLIHVAGGVPFAQTFSHKSDTRRKLLKNLILFSNMKYFTIVICFNMTVKITNTVKFLIAVSVRTHKLLRGFMYIPCVRIPGPL